MGLFDRIMGGDENGAPRNRQVQGLPDMFANPQAMGLLGMAGGLMQAGGYSPTPVSFGQALGMGLQGAQQGVVQASAMQDRALARQRLQGQPAPIVPQPGRSPQGIAPARIATMGMDELIGLDMRSMTTEQLQATINRWRVFREGMR
ncbi:MAG TPA: hypothetical protein VEY95_06380 [Azospirillaceae bacterium]|nr:hypothetical protein [Azospirillaceae bacterium]